MHPNRSLLERGAFILPLAFFAIVLGSALMVLPVAAQDDPGSNLAEEEHLVIEHAARARIPLLLEDFATGTGATPQDTKLVYEVLASDLDYADFFSIVKIPLMGPEDTLTTSRAQALVRGTVEVAGGELLLRGTLESLPGRSRIFSREYRTKPQWYREAAHRFADDIVLYLTGEQGIARTKIAFASNRTGNKEIYIVDYDGHGIRQVTNNGSINSSPAWSPDGSKLAYVSFKLGDADIFVVDLATGKSQLVAGGKGVQSAPAFSPGGTRIIYGHTLRRESELYSVSLDGKDPRRITRVGGINTSPCYSPDGRRIVFTSDRSGNPHLYMTDAEGGRPRRLTYEGTWNDLADWSPDGRRLAYTSRRDGGFRVSLIDPSGLGEERPRTFGPGSDEHPAWAPDSRHLAFVSSRGGGRGIFVMDVDSGRTRTVISNGGSCYGVAWSPVPGR